MKESEVLTAVLEYLAVKRIFHWRNNTGAFPTVSGGFVRFGQKGSPDIIAVVRGRFIGIECKSSKGKLSESQEEWKDGLEQAGGKYVVARSLDDVSSFL